VTWEGNKFNVMRCHVHTSVSGVERFKPRCYVVLLLVTENQDWYTYGKLLVEGIRNMRFSEGSWEREEKVSVWKWRKVSLSSLTCHPEGSEPKNMWAKRKKLCISFSFTLVLHGQSKRQHLLLWIHVLAFPIICVCNFFVVSKPLLPPILWAAATHNLNLIVH
jgi:hypothetical protein